MGSGWAEGPRRQLLAEGVLGRITGLSIRDALERLATGCGGLYDHLALGTGLGEGGGTVTVSPFFQKTWWGHYLSDISELPAPLFSLH